MARYELKFRGRVQGVGFRYTANYIAEKYRLTGFVKNEYDGSVTVEVQGATEAIDQFIEEIGEGRWIRIDEVERTQIPEDPEERGFIVQY